MRIAVLALVVACVAGCPPKTGARAQVVVSIFPLYDLTRRVAGPDADVALLVPVGRSERAFEPSSHEVEEAAAARLGVMVGLGFDTWMEKLMTGPKARLLKVGDRVPTLPARDGAGMDPHVWLDPQRAIVIAKAIGEELVRVDGSHAAGYRKRADDLGDALDALDKEVVAKVAGWKTHGFVSLDAGAAYLADRYGLQIRLLAADAGAGPAGAARLDVLGGGPETDTYEKLIRFNVDALERAFR